MRDEIDESATEFTKLVIFTNFRLRALIAGCNSEARGAPGDAKNCTGLVNFFKVLGLTSPHPKKGYVRPKKEISEKNICSRVFENKNSGMSLLNLKFNMTVYEVLLQI